MLIMLPQKRYTKRCTKAIQIDAQKMKNFSNNFVFSLCIHVTQLKPPKLMKKKGSALFALPDSPGPSGISLKKLSDVPHMC